MMATKRMLHDKATLFVPMGENDDGAMHYDVYILSTVFCRTGAGMTMNNGQNPADSLDLYIFDTMSAITKNGAPMAVATACESIFHVIRDNPTAIDTSEKMYVLPYADSEAVKPPAMCRRVREIVRRKAGSTRMWHWEVHAK